MKNIPKLLHLYWDKSPMSWLQALTPISFHRYNPDWTINLYTPKQSYGGGSKYIPDYKGEDYFPVIEKLSYINKIEVDLKDYDIDPEHHNILRSDILRYHLLYNHGGAWSDFDVIWLRPMTHFYNIEYYGDTPIDDITSVVSLIKETEGGHSIGIMIHCKHDEYAKALVDLIKEVKPPFWHEIFGSAMLSPKYPDMKSLAGFKGLIGVKHQTYYPYDIHPPVQTIHKLYRGNDISYINNNVICLHWYNGHVLSKYYVNGNGFKIDCSMTTVLKNEGYVE